MALGLGKWRTFILSEALLFLHVSFKLLIGFMLKKFSCFLIVVCSKLFRNTEYFALDSTI